MNSEHFHTNIIIPARLLALEPQARLGGVGFVRTNQVQSDSLARGEVHDAIGRRSYRRARTTSMRIG